MLFSDAEDGTTHVWIDAVFTFGHSGLMERITLLLMQNTFIYCSEEDLPENCRTVECNEAWSHEE